MANNVSDCLQLAELFYILYVASIRALLQKSPMLSQFSLNKQWWWYSPDPRQTTAISVPGSCFVIFTIDIYTYVYDDMIYIYVYDFLQRLLYLS